MYAENEPAMKQNEAVLNDLPGGLYTIEVNNKIPVNCQIPLATIQVAQNQKQIQVVQKGCLSEKLVQK